MAIDERSTVDNGVNNASTSVPIAKADFSPAIQDGDVVVVALGQYNDSGGDWQNDEGFTILDNFVTTAGADHNSAMAYKVIADISAEATTWDFYNTHGTEKAVVATAFSGVDNSSPIDVTASSTYKANDATPPGQDITTITDGAMIVTALTFADQNTSPNYAGGAPSGFTLAGYHTLIQNDIAHTALAYLEKATAGAQTVGDWTTSPDSTVPESHVRSLALKPAASGTTEQRTFAGAATPAGALASKPETNFAGSTSPAGALVSKAATSMAGVTAPAGALLSKVATAMAGIVTPLGSLINDALETILQSLTGSTSPVGTLALRVLSQMTGTASPTGTHTSAVSTAIDGNVTPMGSVAEKVATSMTGTVTPGPGSLLEKVKVVLAGSVTPAGAGAFQKVVGVVQETFTGAITAAGALALKIKTSMLGATTPAGDHTVTPQPAPFIGTIAPSGSLSDKPQKILTGIVTPAGSLTSKVRLVLAGVLDPAGDLAHIAATFFAGILVPSGSLLSKAQTVLAGAATPTGSLSLQTFIGVIQQSVAGAITATGSLALKVYHRLAGDISPTGEVAQAATLQPFTGTVTPEGQLTKIPAKSLSGALTPTSMIAHSVKVALAGTLTPAGALVKKARAIFAGTLTPAGSLSISVPGLLIPVVRRIRRNLATTANREEEASTIPRDQATTIRRDLPD